MSKTAPENSSTLGPPAGWAVAREPLHIAVLGWARLSLQAREGSGYNLSASELAAGLALSGHKVSYLRSGMNYSLRPGMHVRKCERWRGVECFDLYNSPNLSPAWSNFRNMAREQSSPDQTRLVLRWLDERGARVVHIHSLEGYSLDLIGAIRQSGRPVVITPHNYWYLCPQVDLHHRELDCCTDYKGGQRCVDCVPHSVPARRLRLKRRIEQTSSSVLGTFWAGLVRLAYMHLKWTATSLRDKLAGKVPQTPQSMPPDPELALGFEVDDARSHPGTVSPSQPQDPNFEVPRIVPTRADENERFLRADHHLTVLNEYGRRRLAGIEAANHASLIIPPSRFLLETMSAVGANRELLRHVRLGQPHFDQLNRAARRSPYYDRRPWDPSGPAPLRLAFLGTTRNNKGLEVVVRAIPLLSKAVRQRCHFNIRAGGYDYPYRVRLAGFPEVSFGGGYDPANLVQIMGEFDVGLLPHIWFENSPLVMLEFLHAGKFIIASRLGGPPEWIVEPGRDHPGNGLLFAAGKAEELAHAITRLVNGEVAVPSAREVHEVSVLQSYPGHVREVESIYATLLGRPPTDAPPPREHARAPEFVAT